MGYFSTSNQTTNGSAWFPTTQKYFSPVTPSTNPNINMYAQQPSQPSGSVLGATTSTGGGGGSTVSNPAPAPSSPSAPSGPSAEEQARIDAEKRLRGEIGGAWDGYIQSLDQQFGMLDQQKGGLEGQLSAQNNKFVNTLGQQLGEGQGLLQQQADKTISAQEGGFRTLDEKMANQMRAGNIYLGARGAGDSSAGDMFNYALGRQGNQIRGDMMGQTADTMKEISFREQNLKRIYDTEINNTEEEYNRGMSEIATWFADSQRQIAQMKGEAGRDKGLSLAQMSYDLLNQAKQRAQQLQDYAMQKQAAVEQWALNNSNTLAQAKQNLAGVAQFSAPGITMGELSTPMNQGAQRTVARATVPGSTTREEQPRTLADLYT